MSETSQWWIMRRPNESATATNYSPINGRATTLGTTETQHTTVISEAGTLTSFRVDLSTNPGAAASGKSYRFQVVVNGTPSTTLDVTILETATGAIATGTVSVSAGDRLTIKVTPTGTPTVASSVIWTEFEPTTVDHYCYPAGFGLNLVSAAPQWATLFGAAQALTSTDTVITRSLAPFDGTIIAVYMSIETAPGVGNSWDFCVAENGSEVAATVINIAGAAKTGNLTGLSVPVTAGNYYAFKIKARNGTPTNTRAVSMCVTIVPAVGTLWALDTNINANPTAAVTNWMLEGGHANQGYTTTESTVQTRVPASMRVARAAAQITNAPGTGKHWTYTHRTNASPGSVTFQIADAATFGVDAAHSDALVAGDLIDLEVAPSGGPATMGVSTTAVAMSSHPHAGAPAAEGGRRTLLGVGG